VANSESNQLLRQLPAVHTILDSGAGMEMLERYGRELVVEAGAKVLDRWRNRARNGVNGTWPPALTEIVREIEEQLYLSYTKRHLGRVVNGTGIILHTNFGRAVLGLQAQEAIREAAACYTNLEYDLDKGERGSRNDHVEELLVRLTGAEAALVVNNNAAAVLLAMNTLASGREVIVSRGELVEIGGSFRIPEVLKMGGVTLVEVGTTNRTHLKDYKKAVSPATGLILKVHTSNFRIFGFVKAVPREELARMSRECGLPLVEDLGSGSLLDLTEQGFKDETPVGRVIKSGVDVVTFSGDKLLGGPQAGIVAGKQEYIEAMKANQLARALRVDKFTLAALEATLREYLRPEYVKRELPIYRMLTASLEELEKKARHIAGALAASGVETTAMPVRTVAQMGGGSLPGQEITSWGLILKSGQKSGAELEGALRRNSVPIIGYLEKDEFMLDVRTFLPGDEDVLISCLQSLG